MGLEAGSRGSPLSYIEWCHLWEDNGGSLVLGQVLHLILLKILSKSFFISTRVRVWSRKCSFICSSRTLDSPLKLISISLVFSKRSSLEEEQMSEINRLKLMVLYLYQAVAKLCLFCYSLPTLTANQWPPIKTPCRQSALYMRNINKSSAVVQTVTHMCLWAWMMALTSSEFTILSILLQNIPEAVGSMVLVILESNWKINATPSTVLIHECQTTRLASYAFVSPNTPRQLTNVRL